MRRIDPRSAGNASLCTACAGLEPLSTCTACGAEVRLWDRGLCPACTLGRRLDDLALHAPPGVVEGLSRLREVLTSGDERSTLKWLVRSGGARLLTRIARGEVPMTHEGLDESGSKAAENLRSVLVAANVIPGRDEELARFERWLDAQLAAVGEREERAVVEAFASWEVVRRLRQRAARRGGTVGDTTSARRTMRAAIRLLDWVRLRGGSLGALGQADLDAWLSSVSASARQSARPFIRWAVGRRLAPAVEIDGRSSSLPGTTLTAEDLEAFVYRLATDSSLPIVERAAGLLVALYGQLTTRLVRLRIDDVSTHDDQVLLRLGTKQVELPPVLGHLVLELVANRRGAARTGASEGSPWLFAGAQPGRPLTADWLAIRIAALGLPVSSLRPAALLNLAAELPASFLVDLLGLSPGTAVRWVRAAGGDWASYAAAVARTSRRTPPPTS